MYKRLATAILQVTAFCGVLSTTVVWAQTAPVVVLDSFETPSIRVVNPTEKDPAFKYLWSQYTSCANAGTQCLGSASVTSAEKRDGNQSLKVAVTSNNAYLQFYPYSNASRGWGWMHDHLASGKWIPNTYNRTRFWVKIPPNSKAPSAEHHNLEFGTFIRARSAGNHNSSAEAGGNHYYHFYNIPPTAEWYQIIVDTHPTHVRGAAGATEVGNQLHPTGESNWNYFDALTRFYLDFFHDGNTLPTLPADYFFERFELYQETNPVNIDQVYSLGGTYVPSSNRLHVGWQHPKNDGRTCHEVRYAFQDIFTLGWNKATAAPAGKVCPASDAYAGMAYDSTAIKVSGQSMIYVAIKPANSNLFNQIAIPIPSVRSGSPR